MYFHMTLSYVGQLLDELSILWTLAVAYSFWYPRVYFPRCIKSRYDSQGHSVAGSEGTAGTLTLIRVTHRFRPPAHSQLPCKGSALRLRQFALGLDPPSLSSGCADRGRVRNPPMGKGCDGFLSPGAACICKAAEKNLHGEFKN